MLVAMILLTRAQVAKQMSVVVISRPTGKTCIRKNGRKLKLKDSIHHKPKRPRGKGSTVDCAWTGIKKTGMFSYLHNQKYTLWGESKDL